MISSLFIANRGEIAVRIIRSCRDMSIRTVLGYSEADKGSLAQQMADQSICIGPNPSADSYLNQESLIVAALLTHCDAIHPGVGFLSENAAFSQMVHDEGMIFVGSSPETISLLGDKIEAKKIAEKNGLRLIPGNEGRIGDGKLYEQIAAEIGFPVIIKAAAGGGGRGMRIAHNVEEFREALSLASIEAEKAFGDSRLYFEKYLDNPRHVEVQLIADGRGKVIHIGERDCSVQRKHQKLIEESPAPGIPENIRIAMCQDACHLFESINYYGVGTVEFLFDGENYYFIEVNSRIQVEHPISEIRADLDLIAEQINLHSTHHLSLEQRDISLRGHAIECRINALTPGTVQFLHIPSGPGIRVDSFLYNGASVPPFYDALVAKVISYAPDRKTCLARMKRALSEMQLLGIRSNIDEQKQILSHPSFEKAEVGTRLIEIIESER